VLKESLAQNFVAFLKCGRLLFLQAILYLGLLFVMPNMAQALNNFSKNSHRKIQPFSEIHLLFLRGMKRNSRCTKEVFTFFHKNNVIFLWLETPEFFYAIFFRAVRGPILVILDKINRAVYF
jgi:hypothetical protein